MTFLHFICYSARKIIILDRCSFDKNEKRKYSYIVVSHSDSTIRYSEVDINALLEFLNDKIYLCSFGKSGIPTPMSTNCATLVADLFLYSYEAEFVQKLLHN